MRVAAIQSSYLPWKGYFDIIHDADLFIFFDDIQYTVRDWRNRNIVKTPQGLHWLTVPVGASRDRLIKDVVPVDSHWQKRHWLTLQRHYARSPYFGLFRAFFEESLLGRQWRLLSEINRHFIQEISREFLGIRTVFKTTEDFQLTLGKNERLLDLLAQVGATEYISGPMARDYLDEERFKALGIKIRWKDYAGYPAYPQLNPPFEHHVSIVDLLFQTGPEAPYFIWGWRENRDVSGFPKS